MEESKCSSHTKKGSRQLKKNYRPISMLPICGKLFEKLIFDEIYDHLVKNDLLTSNQSGFRPGDSAINQLLSITHCIYTALRNFHLEKRVLFFLIHVRHSIKSGIKICSLSSNIMVYRIPSSS